MITKRRICRKLIHVGLVALCLVLLPLRDAVSVSARQDMAGMAHSERSVEVDREQEIEAKLKGAVGTVVEVTPETLERLDLQAECDVPHSALYSQFPQDAQGEWIYPDDFAGLYQGEYGLVVCLTSMDRADWYLSAMQNHPLVELQLRDHSYATLETASSEVAELPGVMTCGVSAEHNAIRVYTSDRIRLSFIDGSDTFYSSKLSKRIPLIIEEQPAIRQERELWGGDPLSTSSTSGLYTTISAGAVRDGHDAIITCGHGNPVGAYRYYDGGLIGKVVFSRNSSTLPGDFSIIQKSSSSPHTVTARCFRDSNSYIDFSRGQTTVRENKELWRYGGKSGWGHVIVTVPYNSSSSKFTVARILSGSSASGDSGCPYFMSYNENGKKKWEYYGCHSGSNVSTGGDLVYFTSYKWIQPQCSVKTIG